LCCRSLVRTGRSTRRPGERMVWPPPSRRTATAAWTRTSGSSSISRRARRVRRSEHPRHLNPLALPVATSGPDGRHGHAGAGMMRDRATHMRDPDARHHIRRQPCTSRPDAATAASASARFSSSIAAMRSSGVPAVTSLWTLTVRVWPIRYARSVAWSSTGLAYLRPQTSAAGACVEPYPADVLRSVTAQARRPPSVPPPRAKQRLARAATPGGR
jgi:hypothetical protein